MTDLNFTPHADTDWKTFSPKWKSNSISYISISFWYQIFHVIVICMFINPHFTEDCHCAWNKYVRFFLSKHLIYYLCVFPVLTADRISGLGSVALWLSRWGVVNIFFKFSVKRLSTIKGHLPSKVVFCERSSSVKGRPPSEIVLCLMSSSIKGHFLSKVVFCQRSSSVKGKRISFLC